MTLRALAEFQALAARLGQMRDAAPGAYEIPHDEPFVLSEEDSTLMAAAVNAIPELARLAGELGALGDVVRAADAWWQSAAGRDCDGEGMDLARNALLAAVRRMRRDEGAVPRGCCGRCVYCGGMGPKNTRGLFDRPAPGVCAGCWKSHLAAQRSHCAGCGRPYAKEGG